MPAPVVSGLGAIGWLADLDMSSLPSAYHVIRPEGKRNVPDERCA
jgi:hypothetical protein